MPEKRWLFFPSKSSQTSNRKKGSSAMNERPKMFPSDEWKLKNGMKKERERESSCCLVTWERNDDDDESCESVSSVSLGSKVLPFVQEEEGGLWPLAKQQDPPSSSPKVLPKKYKRFWRSLLWFRLVLVRLLLTSDPHYYYFLFGSSVLHSRLK
jgi:hypothetical protein